MMILFKKITGFVTIEKIDFWNELNLSEQNEIKKGINELDNGKRVPFDPFAKKVS